MLDKTSKYFTINDLQMILDACWYAGACNLSGLAHDLPEVCSKARAEFQDLNLGIKSYAHHPVIKLMLSQMNFLAGISLGPEKEWVEAVETRMGELKNEQLNNE